MNLLQLLQTVGYKEVIGNADVEISGLCADSRKVTSGDLFFAMRADRMIRTCL